MSFIDAATAVLSVDDFRITFLIMACRQLGCGKVQDLQDITVVLGVDAAQGGIQL